MRQAVYKHTQALILVWAIVPVALVGVGVALFAEQGATAWPGVAVLLAVSAVALLMLGHFTIEVGEGRVEWRYGVLGWPSWQLALDEIVGVKVTASTALEGWGIRRTKTGMLYNAQGLLALRLHLRDGRTLRLGSDEPERLAAFIQPRLAGPPSATQARRATR